MATTAVHDGELPRRRADFGPVGLPKAADVIASLLRGQIIRGELREGDELPPESQLLLQLRVGRPALREALRMLESESLVRVRRGAKGGATVHPPDPRVAARFTGLLLQSRGTTVSDVYQTRVVLEPGAAQLLADRGTKAAHRKLRAALKRESSTLADRVEFAHASAQFHFAIVELAGLATLAHLAGLLAEITDRATVYALVATKESSAVLASQIQTAHRAHARLVELVEARQGAKAAEFWREHMEAAGRLVLADGRGAAVIDMLD